MPDLKKWTKQQLDNLLGLYNAMGGAPTPEAQADAHKKLLAMLKRRGCEWSDLDDLIAEAKRRNAPPPPPPGPPSAPVGGPKDGEYLFNAIHELFEGHIYVIEPHYHTAVSLYVMYSWVAERFQLTPRLHLRSAIEGEGKSTVFDIIEQLVRRPSRSETRTAAELAWEIDENHPTVLLDEVDNQGLFEDSLFRAILNANRQGRAALV